MNAVYFDSLNARGVFLNCLWAWGRYAFQGGGQRRRRVVLAVLMRICVVPGGEGKLVWCAGDLSGDAPLALFE